MRTEFYLLLFTISWKFVACNPLPDDEKVEIGVPRSPRITNSSVRDVVVLTEGVNFGEISCEVFGTPTPSVTWLKNGRRMKPMRDNIWSTYTGDTINIEFDVKTGVSTLKFTSTVSPLTAGEYACIASNFLGRAIKYFSVKVSIQRIHHTDSSLVSLDEHHYTQSS